MPFFRKPGTGQAEFSRYANFFCRGPKLSCEANSYFVVSLFSCQHAKAGREERPIGSSLQRGLNLATKVRVGGVWKSRRLHNEHEMQMREQVR